MWGITTERLRQNDSVAHHRFGLLYGTAVGLTLGPVLATTALGEFRTMVILAALLGLASVQTFVGRFVQELTGCALSGLIVFWALFFLTDIPWWAVAVISIAMFISWQVSNLIGVPHSRQGLMKCVFWRIVSGCLLASSLYGLWVAAFSHSFDRGLQAAAFVNAVVLIVLLLGAVVHYLIARRQFPALPPPKELALTEEQERALDGRFGRCEAAPAKPESGGDSVSDRPPAN